MNLRVRNAHALQAYRPTHAKRYDAQNAEHMTLLKLNKNVPHSPRCYFDPTVLTWNGVKVNRSSRKLAFVRLFFSCVWMPPNQTCHLSLTWLWLIILTL